MKKRALSLLMAIILVFSMFPITVFAADTDVTIVASNNKLLEGDPFTVSLKVPKTNQKPYSVFLAFSFDKEQFEITSITYPDVDGVGTKEYSTESEANTAGEVSISLRGKDSENAIDLSNGAVLSATFKVKEGATKGKYDFSIDNDTYAYVLDTETWMDVPVITIAAENKVSVDVVELISELNISLPTGIDSVPVPETGKSPIVEDWVELVCDDEGIDSAEYQVLTDINTVVGEYFEPGETYIETVKVIAKDGYVIDQNTKLPDIFSGFEFDAGESSGNTYVFSRKTTLDTVVIDKIIITGTIDSPKAFETIKDHNLSAGSGIDISYVIWHGANIVSFPTDEKYTVGDTYRQAVTVNLKSGYEFKDGFSINDIDAPMLDGFTKTYNEEYKEITFLKTTVIDRVNIEEVNVTGDIPAKPVLKETCPHNVELTAENATVEYQIFYNGEIYDLTKYSGDKTYIQTITVTPNENYKFDKNTVITFADEEYLDGFERSFEDGKYVFRRTTKVDKLVIDEITVKGYTDPKTGETYEKNLTFEAEGIEVFFYSVNIKGQSLSLSEGTKYLGDTEYEYQLRFPIAESEYYKFAENVKLVDENGVELAGENGFVETKKDEYEIIFKKNVKTGSATVTGIEVSGTPDKVNYVYGEEFKTEGITVTAKYNDGTEKTIESMHYTVVPEKLVPGTTEVEIQFAGQTATVSGITVAKKELNITGLDAKDRIYDGTGNVEIVGGTLNGVLDGDEGKVYVTMPTAGTAEADASAAPKKVTVVKPELEGEHKDYYTLADLPEIDVVISPKSLEDAVILGIADAEYNSEEHKPVPTSVKLGETVIDDSQYTVSYSADTENVGTVTVTVTGKNNYKDTASTTFEITPATLTMDAAAAGKVFDGNKNTVIDAIKLNGVFAGDVVSVKGSEEESVMGEFASEFVGSGIAVTAKEEFTLEGADAGNYVLVQPTGLSANIAAAEQKFTFRPSGYSAAINTNNDISGWVTSNAGEEAVLVYGIETADANISLDGNMLKVGENAAAGQLITLNVKSDAVDLNGDGIPEYKAAEKRTFKVNITEKLLANIETENTVSKIYGDDPFQIGATVTGDAASEEGIWKWSVSGTAVSITSGADTAKPTFKVDKAGTATVTVIFENRNYRGEKQISVSVAQKEIVSKDFDEIAPSYEYTGSEIKPEIKSATLEKNTEYTVEYSNNIGAGKATVTIKGIGNYCGTVTRYFDITAKAVDESDISVDIPAEGYTYDRNAKEPEVTVGGLIEGTDYTVTYSNNENAGTAKVTVEFKGNYSGKFEKEFEIKQVPVTAVFTAKNKIYDGNTAAKLEFNMFEGVLVADFSKVTYVGTASGNFAEPYVGLQEVTVTGNILLDGEKAGNYKVTNVSVLPAEIIAAEQNVTVPAERQSISQNTSKNVTVLVGRIEGAKPVITTDTLPEGVTFVDGVLSVEADKALGEFITVRVNSGAIDLNGDGEAEYKAAAEKTITFEVVRKLDAEVSVNPQVITKTFGDKNFGVALDVKNTSGEGKIKWVTSDSSVIAIENADTENPTFIVGKTGNAEITVTYEDEIYLGSTYVSVTVEAKKIAECTVAKTDAVTYTGSAFTPTPKVKDGDKVLVLGTDYTISYEDNIDAGTASLIIIGKNNYRGDVRKTFVINKKDIGDLSVSGINASYEYNDGAEIKPVVSVAYGSIALDENDFTVAYSKNVEPGTAKVTITGKGNYIGTVEKTFKITAKNITPTVEISGSYSYTGKAIHPSVVVKHGDKELSGGINYAGTDKDYNISYSNNVNAGAATITVTAAGERYTWTPVVMNFDINRAEYDVVVDAEKTVKVGKGLDAITLPESGNGVNKETVKGTLTVYKDGAELTAEASKELATGDYTLTWKFVPDASETNYVTTEKTGSFVLKVIEKETQTITTSRDEYQFTYGGAAQNIGAKVTVGDGALSYVSSDESVATVDAEGNITVYKVGEATITITAAETTEFAKQTKEVKVKVSPKVVTKPTANSNVFTYNGKDQTYEIRTNDAYTVSGNVQKNAGSYTVTVELKDKVNTQWADGTVDNITFDFVINKAIVKKPVIDNLQGTYNGKEHNPVAENSLYEVKYTDADGNLVRAKNAGVYGVTVELKDPQNYMWAGGMPAGSAESAPLSGGKLTVNKAIVTVTAKDQTAVVGGAVPVLGKDSYTIKGLAEGDNIDVTIKYASVPNMSAPGTYKIIVSGPDNVPNSNNYEKIEYIDGTLTINRRRVEKEEVTIDLRNPSSGRTDDESNPNTGAPVMGSAINAGYAIIAAMGGLLVLGKRK